MRRYVSRKRKHFDDPPGLSKRNSNQFRSCESPKDLDKGSRPKNGLGSTLESAKRKVRALTHDIRLLGRELVKDGEQIVFHVQGSRLYRITYDLPTGWICSCPDFENHRRVCKHIYFLHARALKIELLDDNVLNEIQFGTPKEIMQKLSRSGLKVNDVLRNNYAETGDEKAFSIESKVEQKPFWGENCAICFEDFSKPKDEIDLRLALDSIVYCYGTCGQSIHLACFEASCKFRKQIQCPYCRGKMDEYVALGMATDIPTIPLPIQEKIVRNENKDGLDITSLSTKPRQCAICDSLDLAVNIDWCTMDATIQDAILSFLSPLETPEALLFLPLSQHQTLDAWFRERSNIIFTSTKEAGWRITTFIDNVLYSPWGPAVVTESTLLPGDDDAAKPTDMMIV